MRYTPRTKTPQYIIERIEKAAKECGLTNKVVYACISDGDVAFHNTIGYYKVAYGKVIHKEG